MSEKIQGTIKRVIFKNKDTGFHIIKLFDDIRKTDITAKGNLGTANVDQSGEFYGEWVDDKKYGPQFSVNVFIAQTPKTAKGIENFLKSEYIKGIGPKMSKMIVDKFGEESIYILDNNIERLYEIPGFGEKRVEIIRQSWEENRQIKEIMIYLQGKGVTTGIAFKIYKKYGNDSISVLEANPYKICDDIWGIGFKTADQIAQRMGFGLDSELRVYSGVIFVLNEICNSGGHCFVNSNDLIRESKKLLEIENSDLIESCIGQQIEEENIIQDGNRIFLKSAFFAEKDIAKNLKRISLVVHTENQQFAKEMEEVQATLKIELSQTQKAAIVSFLNSKTMIITGGPGTGKSTIINSIITILKDKKILLAAPTGRAAKRMSEITGKPAKTIHRLLDFNPMLGGFARNEESPIVCDILVIDECSMVDIFVMAALLKAVPSNCRVLLVGDVDQLPSVGIGNVLNDLIESGHVKTLKLTEIFRQAQGSKIITGAHMINRGIPVDLKNDKNSDFLYINNDDPEIIQKNIVRMVKDLIPKKYGYDPLKDIQVLSPMKGGMIGINSLNRLLQQELNPNSIVCSTGFKSFKINDKVMQIKNNYDKDVYNGDIGFVSAYDEDFKTLKVDFDGRIIEYEMGELDELILSYAISIHKSQGSEYKCVIIPIHTQHYIMLKRNLLYTGVTRAKNILFLIGSQKAIGIAVNNNEMSKRNTNLRNLF